MIYILVNSETGRRVKWWPDTMLVEAQETFEQWRRWRPNVWRLETAPHDALANDYPQGDIPDAMGGHPLALMDDGGTLCQFCVADPFNPVRRCDDIRTLSGDGWGVVGWFNSAESEGYLACDHCGTVFNEGDDK